MKTAIQIIREAYAYCGVCPTQSNLNGNMSEEGKGFLNELLYKWNIENYFPFTNNTIDGHVSGGIALISPEETSTFIGEKPININRVLWKDGTEWHPLIRVGYENIWERCSKTSKPVYFAFTNDESGRGKLVFDCENGDFDCRVIYNKSLPQMDYNDNLNAPEQYEQLLKYGVAVKCCIRYGLPSDVMLSIKSEQDAILNAIKKANSFKHAINISERKVGAYDDFTLLVQSGRRM